jgi:DNA polymerase-3 subunit alpha
VGPGRGSGAGSLVAYAMEITNIDPLQNVAALRAVPESGARLMPDIDVDFCQNRRGEVIEYVTRKYGREQVAQIITFNTMAAKAAIKDCGRAMDMPYGDVDRIAKLIPATVGMTIDQALEDVPDLRKAYDQRRADSELIDTAKKLEGLVRGSGVHASAVVIAPRPLTELVPLAKTKNDEIVTAYDMKAVEKMGLLKMDFLGLTTLTVIDDCLKLIESNRGEKVDIEAIPLDDEETYKKVFHAALTSGVFQFESSGMRDVLRRYKPDTVEDLTALNALYRPGPIQGGMIDDFIERKLGRRKVEYMLPELEGILKETLGVIVYQEQVMQISNVLASYSLGEADLLRRAMGKKNAEEMAEQRDRFMAERRRWGTRRNGGRDLRPDGEVCRLRLQQVALGGLCAAGLPDGLSEDALPGGVHGGAADLGDLEAGERGQVYRRVQGDGHQRGAAGRAGFGRAVYAARRGDSLWPGGGEKRRRQCDRVDLKARARWADGSRASGNSARRSISA